MFVFSQLDIIDYMSLADLSNSRMNTISKVLSIGLLFWGENDKLSLYSRLCSAPMMRGNWL